MDKVKRIIMPMILVWMLLNVTNTIAQGSKVKTLFTVKNSKTIAPPCVSDVLHDRLLRNDVSYKQRHEALERSVQEAIENDAASRMGILTVPLVVHVIHTGEPVGTGTNISDEQVYSAIAALNEDYRKIAGTNGDGNGVDCEIEFCLAVRDPQGNPTTGIVRVNGSSLPNYATQGISIGQGSGASETSVKNLSKWPKADYYNIWIVNEIDDNDGGAGIQGFAYFPSAGPSVDGTVLMFNAFGTVGNLKSYTNMNRVTTHEIGHGLNLYHTFEGNSCTESNCNTQGDRVCDTPPTVGNSTNCNSPACGGTQQVENYMDYTGQTCKDMFTNGQKQRMRAALTGSRASLLTSDACTPVSQNDAGIDDILSPNGNVCSGSVAPVVVVRNYGGSTLNSLTIQYAVDGGSAMNYSFSGSIAAGATQEIQLPQINVGSGSHTITVSTVSPNGQPDEYTGNNSKTVSFSVVSGSTLTVFFREDPYGSDNTWVLNDDQGNAIAQGGPYTNGNMGTEHVVEVCMASGCYSFTIYDAYGDGLIGSAYYQVTDSEQGLIATGSSIGDSETTNFCLNGGSGTGGDTTSAPVAQFSANMTAVCVGEAISFTDASTGTPTSWTWSFTGANMASSNSQNPTGIVYNTPGTYSVSMTATNSAGSDTETKTNYIVVYGEPQLTETITHVSCNGANDGNILLSDGNGETGLQFSWSHGPTTANVSGLYAGNYSVVITNSSGCETVRLYTITQPSAMNIVVSNMNPDVDNAGIGSCSIDVTGGASPYSYQWSGSNATSNSLTGLVAGTYVVTVVDANGCSALLSVNISNQDSNNQQAPTANFSASDNNICHGSSINFTDMSTNSPTQWFWEFVGGEPATSTERNPSAIKFNQAGSHTVRLTVTNSNGSDTKEMVGFVQVTSSPEISASIQEASCFGYTNGNINISLAGGVAPFTYNWSNGSVFEDVNSLAGGDYAVTIIDGNGCTTTESFTVGQPIPITLVTIAASPDSCGLGMGSVMILPVGGDPDYTFQWDDPSMQTGNVLENVVAGTYNVTITDANTCYATLPVTIDEVNCGPLGVDENSETRIHIYPNPFDGSSIQMEYSSGKEIVTKVYDMTGAEIPTSANNTSEGLMTINMNRDLSNGMYILKIWDGTQVHIKKIVVRK